MITLILCKIIIELEILITAGRAVSITFPRHLPEGNLPEDAFASQAHEARSCIIACKKNL